MPCLILRVSTPANSNKSFHAKRMARTKLLLELVSLQGRLWKFEYQESASNRYLFYVNVLFLLHNSLVLMGAKI